MRIRRMATTVRTAAAIAALAIGAAAPGGALADPTLGPDLGKTTYSSVVDGPDGSPDSDQYVVQLVAGEKVTLTLAAARNSPLLPDLALVRPDGTRIDRSSTPALPLVETSSGKRIQLRNFPADQSGVWAIVASGRNGTEGSYSLTSRFKKPAAGVFRGILVEPSQYASTYDFAGVEGATATVTLTWTPKSAAVDFTSFTAPDGSELQGTEGDLFDESRLRRNTRTFSKVPLPGPDGVHRLAFSSSVPASYTVKVVVVPPKRIARKRPIVLAPAEPRVTGVTSPVRSAPDRRIRIDGSGFATVGVPRVFFGDAEGSAVAVATTGNAIDVTVPALPDGATVGVTVQNPDLQVGSSPAFLYIIPLPVVTDLTDAAGATVRLGTTNGGRLLRLIGSNFADGQTARFGGVLATGISVNDPQTMALRIPAHAAGDVDVTVTDEIGRSVTAPFQFTYKAPPAFAANPYNPSSSPLAGGTEITVSGTGFAPDDVLRFGGKVLNHTYDSTTRLRFTTPQQTAGMYRVTLTDRAGEEVIGPDFEVKAPPTFDASPYSPVAGTVAGGTVITVTGSAFAADDVLRIDGSVVATTFLSATSFRFSSPAKNAGNYSVSLTDRFGTVVAGPSFVSKAPPTFAATPYSPAGGTVAGGTAVTVTGTGFEADDVLRIDGSVVASIYDSSTQIRFLSPALAAGAHALTLTDRTGTPVSGPAFDSKSPPTFATNPYSPAFGGLAGGTVVTVTGTGFATDDVLRIDGTVVTTTFVSSTSFRFTSPSKAAGNYALTVTDRFGGLATGPGFQVKGAPTVSTVEAIAGPAIGTNGVPFAGGTTIRVSGSGFAAGDVVDLAGTALTVANATGTQFEFDAPSSTTPGGVDLVVTDALGQSVTVTDALRYVGFLEASETRAPGITGQDDFTTIRGALGDLDGDSNADDVVIVTSYLYGYRYEHTRLLLGDGTGLVDSTSYLPKAYSDPRGQERWSAYTVALGDLDGDKDPEIVFGGPQSAYGGYIVDYSAKVFRNDGSGSFSFDYSMSPAWNHPNVYVQSFSYTNLYAFRHTEPYSSYSGFAATNDLALGDLDGDGDEDVVTCAGSYRAGFVHVNPQYINTSKGPGYYYVTKGYYYTAKGYYYYAPAVRIHDNRGGYVTEVSFPRLPLAGTGPSYSPAFPGNDLALGDVDADSDLDIVVTWHDPTTTTPYGMFNGSGYLPPNIATSVLLNDGYGFFQDATSKWLPGGSYPEYWQGHRMELTDLDGDNDPDLVILHGESIDAFTGKTSFGSHALRVLRNDGSGSGFVDVTSAALPSVPRTGTSDDNFRGVALTVADVNSDGLPDILIGTFEALVDDSGNAVPRTRLLIGQKGLTFTDGTAFLPPVDADTGESNHLLLGDIAGRGDPTLVLMSLFVPEVSSGSRLLRTFDWYR